MREAKKVRGVFEKVPGSGVWWVQYFDADGRRRREKVGTRGAAIKLVAKRKTQALEGKKLPENLRTRAVSFAELAEGALVYSKAHKRSFKQDVYRMKPLVKEFGSRAAETITPQQIETWLADKADENEWEPATVNRFKALFSLVFRLGVDN